MIAGAVLAGAVVLARKEQMAALLRVTIAATICSRRSCGSITSHF